jgi:serine/threonine protein kinase
MNVRAAPRLNSRQFAREGSSCPSDFLATDQLKRFEARFREVMALYDERASKKSNPKEGSTRTIPHTEHDGEPPVLVAPRRRASRRTRCPKAPETLIGRTVLHYNILAKLANGGMGVIYRAEDIRLRRQVAVKFASDEFLKNPLVRECFQREACAASSLSHPNICAVYDVGEFEKRPFIVMELLKGETLRCRMGRPAAIEECVDLGVQIADTLDNIHNSGIVHCDIKPSNIFMTNRGQAKLLDFGLAMPVPGRSLITHPEPVEVSSEDELAGRLCALGTPSYMSPEQAMGQPLDARTDLFSLGVVLYEVLTGERPFSGKTVPAVLTAVVTKPLVPLSALRRDLPGELEYVVEKTLEKDRELRCQTAADLRADMKRLQRDHRL